MPDASTEPPPTARHSAWVWLAWAFFIVFIVYPLSIGPAARLNQAGLIPDEVEFLYWPIIELSDHSKPMEELLEWYLVNVWGFHMYLHGQIDPPCSPV